MNQTSTNSNQEDKSKDVIVLDPHTETYQFSVPCRKCGKNVKLTVRKEDYDEWFHSDKPRMIYEVFPYLNPDDREILISGWCSECFDAMCPEED